jgi:hypothetical protein
LTAQMTNGGGGDVLDRRRGGTPEGWSSDGDARMREADG